MKKIITLSIAAATLSLAACSKPAETTNTADNSVVENVTDANISANATESSNVATAGNVTETGNAADTASASNVAGANTTNSN